MAAIRAGGNEANAWRFLKILLSEEIQADLLTTAIELPVLRSAMTAKARAILDTYCAAGGMTEHGQLTFADVSDAELADVLDVLYEVDDVVHDPAVLDVGAALLPYFAGEDSFENCFAAVRNALTLQLRE